MLSLLCKNVTCLNCFAGVFGDQLTVLRSPQYVNFRSGKWPLAGEKIPDLVALTMGFSVREVCRIQTRLKGANVYLCTSLSAVFHLDIWIRGRVIFLSLYICLSVCRILNGQA